MKAVIDEHAPQLPISGQKRVRQLTPEQCDTPHRRAAELDQEGRRYAFFLSPSSLPPPSLTHSLPHTSLPGTRTRLAYACVHIVHEGVCRRCCTFFSIWNFLGCDLQRSANLPENVQFARELQWGWSPVSPSQVVLHNKIWRENSLSRGRGCYNGTLLQSRDPYFIRFIWVRK